MLGAEPDETALAGAEHLDAAYVGGYDRKARLDPSSDVDDLRAWGLDETSTLIDFGAGTGTFALAAAAVCGRVVAIDVSPAMVAALAAKAAAAGITNVETVRAGFLSYVHDGAPADCIYTRNALHHLPDFWKGIALRRMHGLLEAGGRLRVRDLVFSFDLASAEDAVARWVEAAAVESPEHGWTRAELEQHVREEHSTFTWLFEPLLEHAGFEIATRDYGAVGAYADYVCLKRG